MHNKFQIIKRAFLEDLSIDCEVLIENLKEHFLGYSDYVEVRWDNERNFIYILFPPEATYRLEQIISGVYETEPQIQNSDVKIDFLT